MSDSDISANLCVLAGPAIGLLQAREIARVVRFHLVARFRAGASVLAVSGASVVAVTSAFKDRKICDPWYCLDACVNRFPKLSSRTSSPYGVTVSLRRWCSGLELALALVQGQYPTSIRQKCASLLNFDDRRTIAGRQSVEEFTATCRLPSKVTAAISLMRQHIESPIDTDDIAALCDLSSRQLQRLFSRHLGTTPSAHYKKIRLRRAQQLMRHIVLH